MDIEVEKRKEAIKNKLILQKYPTRSNAVFNEENDHNPFVLKNCPSCNGSKLSCVSLENNTIYSTKECSECSGLGVIAEIELYFKNDFELIEVKKNGNGFIKCPNCNVSFSINNKDKWTGLRHKTCGQKILITN